MTNSGLIEQLESCRQWQDSYSYLIRAGKSLTKDDTLCQPDFEVKGCLSRVWVKVDKYEQQCVIHVYSNSKIMAGLLKLIKLLAEQQWHQYHHINLELIEAKIKALGLSEQLSASKSGGLEKILQHLHYEMHNSLRRLDSNP